jgi:hypothetical protein
MLKNVAETIHWSLSLGAHFFRITPIATAIIVILTLIAQVSLMAAMLLPLKIVMLLGSDGMPRFMPPQLAVFERDDLIVGLSVVAVAFYALQALATKYINRVSENGAAKLLAKSEKIVLFENQNEIASEVYKKYAEALASFTFSLLGITVITFLYREAGLAILAGGLIVLSVITICWNTNTALKERIKEAMPALVGGLTNLVFFVVFVTIVVDFLYMDPPGFLVALIGIVLSRQIFSRVGVLIRNLHSLNQQKEKINSLFFRDHAFVPLEPEKTRSVWQFLDAPYLNGWVKSVLGKCLKGTQENPDIKWLQSGVRDVLFLDVSLPTQRKRFLIKLFDKKRTAQAMHEATLLIDRPEHLPAPPLTLTTSLDGYHCHVFDITDCLKLKSIEVKDWLTNIKKALSLSRPSKAIEARYRRSRHTLPQRLNLDMFHRLRLVSERDTLKKIERFENLFPRLIMLLNEIPLAIQNPVNRELVFISGNNNPLLVSWEKWKLEPVGASWNTTRKELEQMEKAILKTKTSQNHYDSVCFDDIEISALATTIETEYSKQNYTQVIEIWDKIADSIERKNDNERNSTHQLN